MNTHNKVMIASLLVFVLLAAFIHVDAQTTPNIYGIVPTFKSNTETRGMFFIC